MKKVPIVRFSSYTLMGLICLIAVLSTNTFALTQTASNSSIQPTDTSSEFIWSAQGIVSQGFRKYQHEGIDIANASGTPIFAAAAGEVIKAGWDDWGLGNAIQIKHPNGSMTVYGHNRRLLVSKGQQVSQNQMIAEMGSTGNSTAPHLHFEIHPDGRVAVNPLNILPSTVAGKIPAPQITTRASRGSQENNPNQVSPPQPISVSVGNTKCNGVTVIQGETANVWVKVCQENGQIFYIGQLKQDPTKLVKIPAFNEGNYRYRADNGSFSYYVSPDKVEVWRNGRQLRSDIFYTVKQS
ncbi:peptidoglycan DD-metalloendopeptidase family protein [Scytonema hofmannii FACHB-248]|uniref:Peptidoglycan DD-metalloendopeptidase family protein n=1 Tax=Scytonema hofmannii FACHB-248 TaxID=1842502 RepID=A0ABR8GMF1_9CYAN|nr:MULTISPECIES: peptidoglycan DD-metalloendopeptidase family protein [Nostocales]MBD2604224.1 peptidoglycan DD-metalloendopeptidase family protein [Scytonema hofmannii FACHB-248]